jgi:para-nitrobenzyl esterase
MSFGQGREWESNVILMKGGRVMKKSIYLILGVLVVGFMLTAFMVSNSGASDNPLRHKTKFGTIEGYADDAMGTWVWKGIPYAAPPIGSLRWKAPRDPKPWEGVLETKIYRQKCCQHNMMPNWRFLKSTSGNEDCLYLNIWRPQTDEILPVYYFIHGGGNFVGNAFLEYGDVAKRYNSVVVTVGYRLGPLGYIAHPALKGDNELDRAANYGLLDIIKGLEWVRYNITAFGGDKNNVTIGGSSGGAGDVLAMITSHLAKGLLHKATVISIGDGVEPLAVAEERANHMIDTLFMKEGFSKETAKNMRENILSTGYLTYFLYQQDANAILKAFSKDRGESLDGAKALDLNHIIDGVVLMDSYPAVIESGIYNKVPVLIGTTAREVGTLGIMSSGYTAGDPNFNDLWSVLYGKKKFEDVFKTKTQKDIFENMLKYGSRMYIAASETNVRKLSARQDNIYSYRFAFGEREGVIPDPARYVLGAAHALYGPFIIGRDRSLFGLTYTEENKAGRTELKNAMVSYWRQFIHTGNPNQPGLPEWKPWSNKEGGPKSIILDATREKAVITMSTEEYFLDKVLEERDRLPLEIRKNVQTVTSAYPGIWLYGY